MDEAYFSITTGLRNSESAELRKVQADLLIRQNRLNEAVKALEAMQKLDLSSETHCRIGPEQQGIRHF